MLIRCTGQKIVALIETVLPVCVERFVDYPQLGRFTLRDEGQYKHLYPIYRYSECPILPREDHRYREGMYISFIYLLRLTSF